MNWDLTTYFPEFDGPEMKAFKESLIADIGSLTEQAGALDGLDASNQAEWEAVYLAYEDMQRRTSHMGSYLGCLTAADAHNEAYKREDSDFARVGADISKLGFELLRAMKTVSDTDFEAFCGRESLKDCRYTLGVIRRDAHYTMSPDQEKLSADLGVDGLDAWGRLYDTISGKLEFEMVYPDGRSERRPMAQRRSLLENPDRRIRQTAFEAGNAAWSTVEDVAAASLNAISGTRHTLYKYEGREHFLDVAMDGASVSRKTIDAMFEAIGAERELANRILELKADVFGLDGIAWYDLGAPLPLPDPEPVPWDRAKEMVAGAFTKAYPALGEFQKMMYEKDWIEWEPREGKRPGAFCTGSWLARESRIFMTYNDTIGDVRTLAHEAGHAFHSWNMRDLRPFRRGYPMTLAESASTFGEMILTEGLLTAPGVTDAQKALILDMEVGHGAIYLMDIPVRYEFERAFYEERASGELSVSRIKELMVETQRRLFGDVLLEGGEDPYFWASKLHFYITGVSFYNFPYTFGFLLSRGLFAAYKEEGPDFLPKYEAFLRLTGSDTCEGVARKSIDRDLESPEFWSDAIRTLEAPFAQLKDLLPSVLPK